MRKVVLGLLALVSIFCIGCGRQPVDTSTSTLPPGKTLESNSSTTLETSSLKIVGQVGGPVQAIAVSGNYAYVGVGMGMTVLDISNPSALSVVGTSETFGYYVEDIAIINNTAFVAAGGSGLYIVDMSNPARPTIIGTYDSPGYAESVTVVDKYAYLADGPTGLRVINISDPAHPSEVATVFSLNYIFDVAVDGRYAYLAAAGAGLLVADMSDPASPKETGSLDTPGYAYGISVSGSIAYIADGWEGIQIIDIAVPVQLKAVSSTDTPGWALDAVVDGNMVYVADAAYGLCIVDISDKNEPHEIGNYETPGGNAVKLAIGNGIVYLADRSNGLGIFNVAVPTEPEYVGTYSPMGFADAVAVSGNYAYVAAGPYGLRVVDISDTSRPREIGFCDIKIYSTSIVITGEYAVVIASGSNDTDTGLYTIDISDPTQPKIASFLVIPGMPQDIVFNSGIAYIANELGLVLVDVSHPVSPVILGSIDYAQGKQEIAVSATWGVAVTGKTAYVPHSIFGLEAVDISNPNNPAKIGVYKSNTFLKVTSITIEGKYAYVTDAPRLHVIDISDPRNMTEVGYFDLPVIAERIAFANDTVYVADAGAGLIALDVSNPMKPSQSEIRGLPGSAMGLTSVDNLVYVADGEAGLFIIKDTNKPDSNQQVSAQSAVPEKRNQSIVLVNKSPLWIEPSATSSGEISADGDANDWNNIKPLVTNPVRALKALYETNDNSFVYFRLEFDGAYPFSAGDISLDLDMDGTPDHNIHIPWPGDPKNKPPALFGISGSDINANLLRLSESVTSGEVTTLRLPLSDFPTSGFAITEINIPPFAGYTPTQDDWIGNIKVSLTESGASPSFSSGRTITVNSPADSGQGTLRWALESAATGDTITFDAGVFPPKSPATIRLTSGLNLQIGSVTIDASNVGVILDGSVAASGTTALSISSNGNTIMGLQIINFPNCGLQITGANNIIGGSRARGTGPMGEGNLINGNGAQGIIIIGDNVIGNRVIGNYVGLDISGKQTLGNRNMGIFLSGAAYNIIGSVIEAEKNVITGNVRNEVCFMNRSNGNLIIGNYIGTDATGHISLGNPFLGSISFELGTFSNIIKRNVISNGNGIGINIADWGSWYNEIIGNYIGVDATGSASFGGKGSGVHLSAPFNRVGGTAAEERNIITGNLDRGIQVGNVTDTIIIGNYIGVDVTGTKTFENGIGIILMGGAHRTFIGGAGSGEQNLISGNGRNGVLFESIGTDINFIIGNYLGTDLSGSKLPNHGNAIEINGGNQNFIQGNTVAYNPGGIAVKSGNYNYIHNNSLIENSPNGYDGGNNNSWDDGHGGNYWSDYKGKDADGDVVGDSQYQILPNGVDKHPLVKTSK